MWITIPRYNLQEKDLVEVKLDTSRSSGHDYWSGRTILKPSIEWYMHVSIYNKLPKINAVVHTHSPYTLAIAISLNRLEQLIEEAKIVVGDPVIIPHKPSGSIELADAVSNTFERRENGKEQIRAVIIRNHGVVAIGESIYQARAIIESLEEWAKIHSISKALGGPKYLL